MSGHVVVPVRIISAETQLIVAHDFDQLIEVFRILRLVDWAGC
jgi:hypothetical protein